MDIKMEFPRKFIHATAKFSNPGDHVPAPYFRRTLILSEKPTSAQVLICGLGFYRLYINGADVTKGFMAPYISNPDDIIYYDSYEIASFLTKGENVIGICLGNGFLNNPGGRIWRFDSAIFRSSPQVAFSINIEFKDSEMIHIESDETVKTAPSPILFDDYRFGEHYDARKEISGWNTTGEFDESGWSNATMAPNPRGEARICIAEPIRVTQELRPVSIIREEKGYVYDFGVNTAGICRLSIQGHSGQEICLYHGELMVDGKLDRKNILFEQMTEMEKDYLQKSVYICKGDGVETHTPDFAYNGFRYVLVTGIEEHQATDELLTCLVMHSDVKSIGGFSCSDEMANTLQTLVRRSDLDNLYYFPTDCPQREKNGWTADAALSAEHMLMNLSVEKCYEEWLNNIRKSQREDGRIPGIVPTSGWGFDWGNGPAWDSVLVYLPYFTYLYRGDKAIIEQNATAIFRYLHYLTLRQDKEGLLSIGLGDWCPAGRPADAYQAPLILTDSIISMDLCEKASYIFECLGMNLQKEFADKLRNQLRTSIRANLVDTKTGIVVGDCQTSQAMAIFYKVFDEDEMEKAFAVLLRQVADAGNHITTGVLGGRVIFHVLSAFGYGDLAFEMITRTDFPSYGNWVARGATTLWEDFQAVGEKVDSLNHHFWGDISSWFIQCIAGIRINPGRRDWNEVCIRPSFLSKLSNAKAYHITPMGKIESSWRRDGERIVLNVAIPEGMHGKIILEPGFVFENATNTRDMSNGTYVIVREENRV